jgi:pilus assembly protein CpaB
MNARRMVTAFVLALLCSGLLTWGLSNRLAKPSKVVAAAPVWQIVVAAKDMKVGDSLDTAHMETMNWPASRALPGAFGATKELTGRVLLYPLSSGEPILPHDLAAVGAGAGLTASIPDGMRAISVRTDEVADVPGFVMPGSFVDVLMSCHTETTPGFASSTVLENVRVLAVGQMTAANADSKPIPPGAVTLLVTPQDAVKLAQASSLGKIALVLRNGADQTSPTAASKDGFGFGDTPRKPAA